MVPSSSPVSAGALQGQGADALHRAVGEIQLAELVPGGERQEPAVRRPEGKVGPLRPGEQARGEGLEGACPEHRGRIRRVRAHRPEHDLAPVGRGDGPAKVRRRSSLPGPRPRIGPAAAGPGPASGGRRRNRRRGPRPRARRRPRPTARGCGRGARPEGLLVERAPAPRPRPTCPRSPPAARAARRRCRAAACAGPCAGSGSAAGGPRAASRSAARRGRALCVTTAAITSVTVSPANSERPVSISHTSTPKDHTSARLSTGLPRACSGDM